MESPIPWRKLTAAVLIGLLAAVAGAWLFRLPLAESLIAALLEARGLSGNVRVVALGPTGIRLADVRLEGVTVESLAARWRWSPSAGFAFTGITVVGPVISVDLNRGRDPLPILTNILAMAGDGDESKSRIDLPALTVARGTGVLLTSSGPLDLDFDLDTEKRGPSARAFVGKVSTYDKDLTASADIIFEWKDGAPAALTATWQLADGRGDEKLNGHLNTGWHGRRLDADFEISGMLSDNIPRRLGLIPDIATGRIGGTVAGQATWPLMDDPLLPASEPASVAVTFQLDGTGMNWPGALGNGRLAWSGNATYDRDTDLLTLTPASPLTAGLQLEDLRAHFPALEQMSVPGFLGDGEVILETGLLQVHPQAGTIVTESIKIDISGDRDNRLQASGPVEIRLKPSPSLSFLLDTTLALPRSLVTASELMASGQVGFDGGPNEFTLVIPGPMTLSASLAPEVLPAAIAFLAGRQIKVNATARETHGPPCLRLESRTDKFSSTFGCRLTLTSPALGRLELQATGVARPGTGDLIDVDVPTLEFLGTDLPTPYGTVDRTAATGHLTYREGRLDADFEASADATTLTSGIGGLHRGRVSLRGSLTGTPDDVSLSIAPSSCQAESLEISTADRLRLTPVSIEIPDATVRLRPDAVSVEARAATAPMSLETGTLTANLGKSEITFSQTESGNRSGRLRLERIEHLQHGIAAYDIRIDGGLTPEGRIHAELAQSSVRDLNLPQRFPPSRWTGVLLTGGPRADAKLDGRLDAAPQAEVAVTAQYDMVQERGHAEFTLEGMDFGKDFQPKTLWPGAGDLDNVSGYMTAAGAADFGSSGLVSSEGRLNLELDSFESGGTKVAGLKLPLSLSSLWPVESPPGQHLTIASIGDGTGATAFDVEYRLTTGPGGTPVVVILGGGLDTLGGRLRIAPTRLDSGEAVQSLVLEAEDLDLVSVLSLITPEGIGGEGRLSGRFPVRLEGEDLVIDGAVLQSQAPGRLVFSSAAARETLKSSGDHMTLLLQALQNFHYQQLSLSIDKAAAGDARLHLFLLGNNPDVLEGYPFSINIDLQTDVAPLLSVLRQGNDMIDEVVKRIWRP